MKKLLIPILAVGVLLACNNKKAEKTEGKTTDKENKDEKTTTDDKDDVKDKTTTAGWPEKDRQDFMSSCVEEAVKNNNDESLSRRYCQCMLDKMEAKYPDVNDASKLTDQEIQDVMNQYAAGCRNQ